MKCIAGENPQKASVMENTWLLITGTSVWLSEPTTYSLCQQWRALWSLPLMLHGNRLILSEFVPCLSLVYILFAPSCHQFVPLRNFSCWWVAIDDAYLSCIHYVPDCIQTGAIVMSVVFSPFKIHAWKKQKHEKGKICSVLRSVASVVSLISETNIP